MDKEELITFLSSNLKVELELEHIWGQEQKLRVSLHLCDNEIDYETIRLEDLASDLSIYGR